MFSRTAYRLVLATRRRSHPTRRTLVTSTSPLQKRGLAIALGAGGALSFFVYYQSQSKANAQSGKGKPVVIAGPSGVGKGTLIAMLTEEYPDKFNVSVSHTTRQPRPGEKHGVNYFFVTREQFEADLKAGKFIESNLYNGHLYGTSIDAVRHIQESGKICVLDIDINGCISLKKTDLGCRYVFISPGEENPMEVLEKRLRGRATDDEGSIQRRLDRGKEELKYKDEPGFFDVVIVNDAKEKAYVKLKQFLKEDL